MSNTKKTFTFLTTDTVTLGQVKALWREARTAEDDIMKNACEEYFCNDCKIALQYCVDAINNARAAAV